MIPENRKEMILGGRSSSVRRVMVRTHTERSGWNEQEAPWKRRHRSKGAKAGDGLELNPKERHMSPEGSTRVPSREESESRAMPLTKHEIKRASWGGWSTEIRRYTRQRSVSPEIKREVWVKIWVYRVVTSAANKYTILKQLSNLYEYI